MNSLLELLKLSLNDSDQLSFDTLLRACDNNKIFQKQCSSPEPVISYLNSFLNVNTDFENGLRLLRIFLPQYNSDVLGKHLLQWLQLCIKGLRFQNITETLFCVLRELIIHSKDFPDVRKETSLTVVPKFLEYFFRSPISLLPQVEIPFLLCLDEIIQSYGRVCNNWKKKIEPYLLSKLECSIGIVLSSAKCYLHLAATAPNNAGNKAANLIGGINKKEGDNDQWSNKQFFLITVLHAQLDELFHSVNEIQGTYEEYLVDYDKKLIPEISDRSPLRRAQRLCNYFESLSEFLSVMLLDQFPLEKAIDDEAIFSVICRGLSVNCKVLETNVTNDTIILTTLVPNIQIACLSMLDALIKSCRQDLIKDGDIICKLLTQTLKWTDNSVEYGQSKAFSELRVKAYTCFNDWLTVSRTCSNIQPYISDLVPLILTDIHYEKPSITLNVSSNHSKGKISKKERKKKLKLSNAESKPPVAVNPEANKEICESALNFVTALLTSSFLVISPKFHKQLQECIINELFLSQLSIKVSNDLPIPYSDESCRLALFEALLSLCNNYHPGFPAPCNYALPIFTSGLSDYSLKISRFCSQAAGNIEKMLYPIGHTLNFPLQLSDEISTKFQQKDDTPQLVQNTGNNKSGEIAECETTIIESITNLFEKNSEVSRDGHSGMIVETNGETEAGNAEIQNTQQITVVENLKQLKPNGLSHDINKESKSNVNTPEKTIQIETLEKSITLDTENVLNAKANKRFKIDDSQENDVIEKRTKSNNDEAAREINELESEMISSFVDIVD